jgi:TetR/AcrR family transcriptional regulator, regulator of cefoperazone and chloramphenicol sensitivity
MIRVMKIDTPVPKELRIDGQEARTRLLDAALTLFAEKGFAATSIRELALAAQVNVSAISYYFGDKAGLYRAVYEEPRNGPHIEIPVAANLTDLLRGVLQGFTEPLKQGPRMQQCMKLHYREMVEPTGLWQEEIDKTIKPGQIRFALALAQLLGVQVDDDIYRLTFSITGLGIMMHMASEVIGAVRPALNANNQAIDDYTDRLLEYALAMVAAEAQRRQIDLPQPHPTPETAP